MAGYIGTQAVSVNTTSATISDDLAVGDDLAVTGLATIGETLAVTGVVTANAGVVVDNFTLDGTTLALSSGDFTVDVAGDIILNADGGDIKLQDGSNSIANLTFENSGDFAVINLNNNKDIIFRGNDGGADVNALTLDMSDGGQAIFNQGITTGVSTTLLKCATNDNIRIGQQTHSSIQAINDAANAFVELKLDASALLLNSQSTGSIVMGSATVNGVNSITFSSSGTASHNTSNTSQFECLVFRVNTTQIGSIVAQDGNSTTYNTSSDYRLKENVDYTWDATTRLKQLKPARFNFISDADRTVDGFLAHEAQAVVPECITGTKDEVEVWKNDEELPDGVSVGDNKLDTDGNTIPKMQGIDQSKLVPLLVKTIQELEARITALEG